MEKVVVIIICILMLGIALSQSDFMAPVMRSLGLHVAQPGSEMKGTSGKQLRDKESRVRQAFHKADQEIAKAGR